MPLVLFRLSWWSNFCRLIVHGPQYVSCIITRCGEPSHLLVNVVGGGGSTSSFIRQTFVLASFRRHFFTLQYILLEDKVVGGKNKQIAVTVILMNKKT